MAAQTRERTILVLEDDDVLRELIVETLEDEGYKVLGAGCPDVALTLARDNRFHLLVTDVRMAGSTDGVGVLEQLKLLRPTLKSIIITGYASHEVPIRAMKAQADDYLLKGDAGFGVRELLRVVKRVLAAGNEVGSLWRKALGLFQLPVRMLAEARIGELEAARQVFFGHLFLAIRPAHLSCEQTFPFWTRVEELENGYHKIENPKQVADLTRHYLALSQALLDGQSAPPHDRPGDLSLKRFRHLYEGVRSGEVSAPNLQDAALLRLRPELRRASVETYTLYGRIWGADSDSHPAQTHEPDERVGLRVGSYRLQERLEGVDDILRYRALSEQKVPHLVEIVSDSAAAREISNCLYHEVRDGHSYLVRHWSENSQNLRSWMIPGGLPSAELVPLLRGLFEVVHQAHQQKVYDGALSPQRIVLTGHGPRIPFFGHRSAGDSLYWLHPPYVDPRLLEGGPLLATCDQYSLGMLCLELWTGLSGLALAEVARQTQTPSDDPNRLAFDRALRQMIAADPDHRFPDLMQAYLAMALAAGALVTGDSA